MHDDNKDVDVAVDGEEAHENKNNDNDDIGKQIADGLASGKFMMDSDGSIVLASGWNP
jgi:hypothetical protein